MTLTPDINKDLEFHQPTPAELHLRINKLEAELTTLRQLLRDQFTTASLYTTVVAAELGAGDETLAELFKKAAMQSYTNGLNRLMQEDE